MIPILVGGVTYGYGASYSKPWARWVGGALMLYGLVGTIVAVVAINKITTLGNVATGATPP